MPKKLLEGDTRANPETGVEEVYTPEGSFIPVKERPEAVNKNSVSMISTDEGEEILDQTKSKFETQYGLEDETPEKITDDTAKDVVIEEEEKEKGTGYTFEEAQEIWGNDFTGIRKGADGSFYPDSSAYERAGVKGMGEDLQEEVDETDQLIEDEFSKWQGYNVETDPAFISQTTAITAQYDVLRRQMEQKNKARQRAIETIGYRSGSRQYAGQIQLGIEGEELRQAGERITDIKNAEMAAKSATRLAYESNEYTKFSKNVDILQDIRKNKAEALTNYNETLIAFSKKMETDRKFELDILRFQLDAQKAFQTTTTKEYALAKEEGFKGTLLDYQREQEEIKRGQNTKIIGSANTGYILVDEFTGEILKRITGGIDRGGGGTIDEDESLTAGMVRDIKYLTTAPDWFRKRVETTFDRQFQTPTEATIQKEWDAMKTEDVDVDKEETVWAWLSTPEAQALSDEEKKTFIMGYGLNPDKFNIY